MSLRYDGSLLDHLAEHLIFLSTAPSFWYSLNSRYDHGFHISHHLGMTLHDYKRLLAAANLAHCHPKCGFTMLVDRWKMFLEGHHFYTYNSMLSQSFPMPTAPATAVGALPAAWLLSVGVHVDKWIYQVPPRAALSSSHRAGWLLRPLLMHHPLVVLLSCCAALSSSCCASWLSHHHLLASSRCTALLSSHRVGWLLCCLSLRCPFVLLLRLSYLPHHCLVVVHRRCHRMPSNATAAIKRQCHHRH